MKKLMIPLVAVVVLGFLVAVLAFVIGAAIPLYLTEVTITPDKEKSQYQVEVRVTPLAPEQGRFGWTPMTNSIRITAPLGQPASGFSGATGPGQQGMTAEMFCPKPGEGDFAFCTVTVNRGSKVVSAAKFRFRVEGN